MEGSDQLDDLTIDVVQTRLQGFGNFVPYEILREVLEEAWSMDPKPDQTVALNQRIAALELAAHERQVENEGLVRHINMLNAELARAADVSALEERTRLLRMDFERAQQGIPRDRSTE